MTTPLNPHLCVLKSRAINIHVIRKMHIYICIKPSAAVCLIRLRIRVYNHIIKALAIHKHAECMKCTHTKNSVTHNSDREVSECVYLLVVMRDVREHIFLSVINDYTQVHQAAAAGAAIAITATVAVALMAVTAVTTHQ